MSQKIWELISLNFIVRLPTDRALDAILVVVNQFSNMAHFSAMTTKILADKTIELLIHHAFCLHGTFQVVVSHCGPQFISLVRKQLCGRLSIELRLRMSCYPQTDGQTECVNTQLEQFQAYVNQAQDD